MNDYKPLFNGRHRIVSKEQFAELYERVLKGELRPCEVYADTLGITYDQYKKYVKKYKQDKEESAISNQSATKWITVILKITEKGRKLLRQHFSR